MSEDVLAQVEKLCERLRRVSQHWRNQSNAVFVVAGDMLPQLLIEAKLWKATAIKERATVLEIGNREYGDGTLDVDAAMEQATRELEEEMRNE